MDRIFILVALAFAVLLVLVTLFGIQMTAVKTPQVLLPQTGAPPKENRMLTIPGGPFIMGSTEGGRDEQPVRHILLPTYTIQQFEVTQAQYAEFVYATRHRSPLMRSGMFRKERAVEGIESFAHPDQPVVRVSWNDAYAYCRWRDLRLPSEAEWEKAARGTKGQAWPWGEPSRQEGASPAAGEANVLGKEDGATYTAMVGTFEADRSPYGLYDMAGNAREWVADWYDEIAYIHMPQTSPLGPPAGTSKALRGGSWNDAVLSGRTTARMKMIPKYRDTTIGFRCAGAVPP